MTSTNLPSYQDLDIIEEPEIDSLRYENDRHQVTVLNGPDSTPLGQFYMQIVERKLEADRSILTNRSIYEQVISRIQYTSGRGQVFSRDYNPPLVFSRSSLDDVRYYGDLPYFSNWLEKQAQLYALLLESGLLKQISEQLMYSGEFLFYTMNRIILRKPMARQKRHSRRSRRGTLYRSKYGK